MILVCYVNCKRTGHSKVLHMFQNNVYCSANVMDYDVFSDKIELCKNGYGIEGSLSDS